MPKFSALHELKKIIFLDFEIFEEKIIQTQSQIPFRQKSKIKFFIENKDKVFKFDSFHKFCQ
jgi:uncharacterized protein YqfB (UPF0267 family)